MKRVASHEEKTPRRPAGAPEAMLADLRARGLRITPQRIAIVKLFAGARTHPTAQDIFERLHADFPSMSFATVYNTLEALTQAGLSSTLRLGGAARFDPNTAPHHHAVCDRCGAVVDVPVATLQASEAGARRVHKVAPGFAVRSVERVYRGLCARCARGGD